jgi:acetyl esterase/lipase
VDYRLAPDHKFPAMIEDVKCAVRYLRAHADEYNLDPERIGAIGGSAGGHLVALLGVTDPSAGFEVGEYLDYSSRVKAVVSISGFSDLTPPFTAKLPFDRMSVFGTTKQSDPIFRQASPVKHVTADDPPFLLIHGEKDETVPINQSDILYRQLLETGLDVEFIRVKNAGHTYEAVGENPISPSADEIKDAIMEFWEKYLVK